MLKQVAINVSVVLKYKTKLIVTSIFSEKISPANDGLFVVDGLFVHEGLYVYVQLTYKFQLFRASSLQDVGSYNIQVSSNSRS